MDQFQVFALGMVIAGVAISVVAWVQGFREMRKRRMARAKSRLGHVADAEDEIRKR